LSWLEDSSTKGQGIRRSVYSCHGTNNSQRTAVCRNARSREQQGSFMLIRLFQQATACSAELRLARRFPRLCANSSGSLRANKPTPTKPTRRIGIFGRAANSVSIRITYPRQSRGSTLNGGSGELLPVSAAADDSHRISQPSLLSNGHHRRVVDDSNAVPCKQAITWGCAINTWRNLDTKLTR
jgi:hypothetical protein